MSKIIHKSRGRKKGLSLSKEVKEKIGNSLRGRKRAPFTEEHIENLRKSHLGQVNYWKGKKLPYKTGHKFEKGYTPWIKGKKHSEESKKKMSLAQTGKKISYEQKRKMSEIMKGDKNPSWKGGITSEVRMIRRSLEYRLWRTSVFERDNYMCIWCGCNKSGSLQADHIKPFSQFPELRFAIDNGRTLCIPCHKTTDTWGNKAKIRKHE